MQQCLICKNGAVYGDLCKDCWLGMKLFHHSPKLLGRAIHYLGKKHQLVSKHQRRVKRKRGAEIRRLAQSQWRDDHDRELRFEHAISE